MSWETLKIEDFADVIGGGTPSTKNNSYWNGDIPWICPRDLSNWNFKYIDRGDRNISNLGLEKSSAKLLPVKTVLMTSRAPIGYVAIAKNEICTNQGFQNLVCKENISDPNFVYYLIKEHIDKIKAVASGATFPEISKTKLKGIELPIPPLQTQKRIADILSAYDDLIQNNLKRIKLLEQAAQNIYKEWFVNLRFHGHENNPINEETGLPEGWEEVLMEDIMNVSGGGTPSTKEPRYWEEGKVLWFSPTDLNKNNSLVLIDSTKKITELGLKKSSAKLLPKRTILMSSRATIGLFGLFNGECSTNQGFININPKEESLRYYILFNLKSRVDELVSNANGATFKELSKRVFKRMSIVRPDTKISTKFYNQVELFINQTENLEFQNQKLKAARDILLPRLMNRTIEV